MRLVTCRTPKQAVRRTGERPSRVEHPWSTVDCLLAQTITNYRGVFALISYDPFHLQRVELAPLRSSAYGPIRPSNT